MRKYTLKQVQKFCEDNFIEDDRTWIYNFIRGQKCTCKHDKNNPKTDRTICLRCALKEALYKELGFEYGKM